MSKDLKRIVCGTDFSVHAAEASDVAAEIAKRLDETLLLVHVAEHEEPGTAHRDTDAGPLHDTREQLRAEAGRLRQLGARVKEELLTGSPYQALVDAAGRPGIRLVVVASLGKIAPSRFLVGSVAERTAESSVVPTLVVRQSGSLLAWVRDQKPLKVVVGCDFSASADAALGWLRELRAIGPCEITVTHVNWPPGEQRRLGLHGPISLTENLPEVQQVLERDLKERVAAIFDQQPVALQIIPGWGRTDAHLIQLAQDAAADLLVLGTHQHHGLNRFWLGSVSRGVLHHAPLNVAVVPRPVASQESLRRIPEFRRVLVPTDFSELGNGAIPCAYASLRRGGTVKLIHVIRPWEPPGPLVPHYQSKPETEKQHKQHACATLEKLHRLIPEQAEPLGITTECEVIENRDAGEAIRREAERFGADLICIASHGRSGLSQVLLGSVAQAVISQTKRPVLLLRSAKP